MFLNRALLPLGTTINSRESQQAKALGPIFSTELGRITFLREEQYWNALDPILFKLSGINTCCSDQHP